MHLLFGSFCEFFVKNSKFWEPFLDLEDKVGSVNLDDVELW